MSSGSDTSNALGAAGESGAGGDAGARGRIALATTSGAHFLHDGIADSLYVLLPLWAQTFGLNYTEIGGLKSAYSAAMALFQMPAGMLGEKYGAQLPLVGGTLLAGAAFAAMAAAGGYLGLLLIILVVGLGSAVQHPLSSTIISEVVPAAGRRAALGVYNFAGDVGKMVVAFGVATLAGVIGWRATAVGYGGLVVIAGAALLLVLMRHSLGQARAHSASIAVHQGAPATQQELLPENRRGFTLLSCVHAVDSAGRTGALTLLPFVLLQQGAATATIGLALAGIFAGGAAGKLACGLLADRIGIVRTVVLTEIATAIILVTALLAPLAVILALTPLLGIALNGTSSVLYGTVGDFVRADRQARAFGLFYTVGSAFGGASPIAFGALSDGIGLTPAIVVLAGCVLATLPLALLLRPHLDPR